MKFCGYRIEPGQKRTVRIPVPRAEAMELIVICGRKPGNTLVITAGVHGCEYVGIEAAGRLAEVLDPQELRGNVILAPLLNRNGFFQGRKQVVPEDGENLNRAFPGRENGTVSSRIAYVVETSLYPYADFLIDLHSGDSNESLIPLVFCPGAGRQTVNQRAEEAAKTLSVPFRVRSGSKNGLYSWAVQKEIPALLIERGANGLWSEQEVEACMQDVFRVMAFLDIREGSYEPIIQMEIRETVYEEAEADGFWYPVVRAGDRVYTGDRLGCFRTYPEGKEREIRARFDGLVLYHTTALGVRSGESLIAYGKADCQPSYI